MQPDEYVNMLADLSPGITVLEMPPLDHFIEISVGIPSSEVEAAVCPECGSHIHTSKGTNGTQTLRHVSSGGRGILLTFPRMRLKCSDCGKCFTFHPSWQHPNLRITMPLYLEILDGLTSTLSIKQIAHFRHVTVDIVRDVLAAIEFSHNPALPEIFCIDEFHGDSGEWNPERGDHGRWDTEDFHACIVNGCEGAYAVDVIEKRTFKVLYPHFRDNYTAEERNAVKFFTCDMHDGYKKLQESLFPDAILCVDRFHVIERLNRMVDDIRCRIQNRCTDAGTPESKKEYDLLKDSMRTLTTRESNRQEYWRSNYNKKMKKLDSIYKSFPDLVEACDRLQEFHVISEENIPQLRSYFLSDWISRCAASDVPEIRAAAKTIDEWKPYILNNYTYGHSNAPCEAVNNVIKVLKKNSFGVHNFELFRKRILLACGNMKFPRRQHTIFADRCKKEADCSNAHNISSHPGDLQKDMKDHQNEGAPLV